MKKAILLVLVLTLGVLGVAAPAGATHDATHIPVTGTVTDRAGTVIGTFDGMFDIERFRVRQGELQAVGILRGTLTTALGTQQVGPMRAVLPVNIGEGATCTILTLDLGPLDLNLLGLHVHLDEVHLVIEAHEGQGLLGDLLCAVANLLDTGGTLRQIAGLLNQILDLLQ
jgi:hypothetical protein